MEKCLATSRPPTVNTYGFLWSHRADEALWLLLEKGYREFELMMQPPHLSLDPKSPEAMAIRSLVSAGTLELHSLNMPSLDLNLASAMEDMRAYSVDMFCRQIRLAGALGARRLVVAPGRISPLFPAPPSSFGNGFGMPLKPSFRSLAGRASPSRLRTSRYLRCQGHQTCWTSSPPSIRPQISASVTMWPMHTMSLRILSKASCS